MVGVNFGADVGARGQRVVRDVLLPLRYLARNRAAGYRRVVARDRKDFSDFFLYLQLSFPGTLPDYSFRQNTLLLYQKIDRLSIKNK